MSFEQLAPIADILIRAYGDTANYSRWFIDEYGHPPTQAAKGGHLRAVVQSRILDHDSLKLGAAFAESGRIEITDIGSGTCYLLRSRSTVTIERYKQESLFDASAFLDSHVVMVIHQFHKEGLDLSIAGTRHPVGKSRLVTSGTPTFIGTWLFAETDAFDQDDVDPFGDVGEIADEDEGEGESI